MVAKAPETTTDESLLTDDHTDRRMHPRDEPVGCTIRVLRGDPQDLGRNLLLEAGTALIGSAGHCDLVLNDKRVSRRHLEIRVEPNGIGVRDLGSSNGSFVLGNRLLDGVVPYGAQVVIGKTTLELLPLTDTKMKGLVRYGELIGASESMRHLFALLRRIEKSDATVLIIAETGTGKELVARAVHDYSPRKAKPLVVFDCASVPRELVESELFGHMKGAFTGAQADRQGVFEQADGGTLFLDEIGELPADTQTRLLRVLERGEVKRVGGNGYKKVDVRIVAATHRDLRDSVQRGTFRADLYYRLAIVPMTIPPLRVREGDITILAQYFAEGFGAPMALSPTTLAELNINDWPGNVRELRNAVHRIVVLGDASPRPMDNAETVTGPANAISANDDAPPQQFAPYKAAKERMIEEFESKYLRDLLAKHNGNVSAAAREAGLSRRHLHELLRKHNLGSDE